MGLRFRKSIKLAPGVRVNFNKKSTSLSFGGKGGRYTVSSTGKKTSSVGIPGTGLSYVTTTGGKKKKAAQTQAKPVQARAYSPRTYKFCGVILIVLAAVSLLLGLLTIGSGGLTVVIIGALCLLFGVVSVRKAKTLKNKEKPEA